MHISQMDPLKGSVSWTGKPVSYFLHVIDRAKVRFLNRTRNKRRHSCWKYKQNCNLIFFRSSNDTSKETPRREIVTTMKPVVEPAEPADPEEEGAAEGTAEGTTPTTTITTTAVQTYLP